MRERQPGLPGLDFQVRRDDLGQTRVVEAPLPDPPQPGAALLAVHSFALTANNITYAVVGEALGYWRFFPAPAGWGRIPVWGFADVVASRAEGVAEGERVFGYLPMSTHLVVQPRGAGAGGFTDGSPHRAGLPGAYNLYTATRADPLYVPEHEPLQALLWPLFVTAFLLDDFLHAEGFFGAEAVILSSASSRTAVALAFLLHERAGARPEVVGLTSERNREFVAGLGCYDRALLYGAVPDLDPARPAVFVDFAGDAGLTRAVHERLGGGLRHSARVGLTHFEDAGEIAHLPGPEPAFFFAPDRIASRLAEWGAAGLRERQASAWHRFVPFVRRWLRVERASGPEEVARVYREVLAGRARPEIGPLLSLAAPKEG